MSFQLNPALKSSIQRITFIGQLLFQKGWAEKNAGNLSWDVTDDILEPLLSLTEFNVHPYADYPAELQNRWLFVTGTNTRFRDIEKKPDQCLGLLHFLENQNGYACVWGGQNNFKPTSELHSHLRLHHFLLKQKKIFKVVLHTHPDELIALTHLPETNNPETLNWALWGMLPEVKLFAPQGIGLVPYHLTGTDILAQATVEVLTHGHQVILWEKHGVLALGTDPEDAFDQIDVLNKAAKIYLLCKQTGQNPQRLTQSQIEEISRTYQKKI
jgi:rhamnulose-1-phosphate aldolase